MIYVNTTTASPDTIKYSNQIDITRKAMHRRDEARARAPARSSGRPSWAA